MSPKRILSALAAAALAVTFLGACGESLTERAVSFGLEQAVEGDQDIDLNFDDDNGSFSISTDEGEFSLNLDGDNGSINFNTDEGDGVIQFDEDGIVFDTDEGDGVIQFDEDGIVFNTDEGDGILSFDDDGSGGIVFESEGGSQSILGSTAVPATWPAEFGVPATSNPNENFFTVLDTGSEVTMSGVFKHSPSEDYAGQVLGTLGASGWTVAFQSEDGDGRYVQLANGSQTATVFTDGTGLTTVALVTN